MAIVRRRCRDEDAAADLYLAAMQRLDEHGYRQYEISNTAQPGAESRHNLKYWDSRPYLGIGPAGGLIHPRPAFHLSAGYTGVSGRQ